MILLKGYRAAQLALIYMTPKGQDNSKPLTEDEVYDKYGQRKYVRYVLVIVILAMLCGAGFIVYTFILIGESDYPEAFFILNMFTMISTAIGQFIIFIFASSLLHRLHENISMSFELLIILTTGFIASTFYHAFVVALITNLNTGILITMCISSALILLVRNIIYVVVSIVWPLMQSKEYLIVRYNETRDCAKTLELVLCSKTAYLHFTKYIENKSSAIGNNLISLFNLLMLRKDRLRQNRPVKKLEDEIMEIYDTNTELKEELNERKSVYMSSIYDSLMERVMSKLKRYFRIFKLTKHYTSLLNVLTARETINERLKQADLV